MYSLCGSDIHTARGKRSEPVPTILGHEVIGTIESFGPQPIESTLAEHHCPSRSHHMDLSASCGDCSFVKTACLRNACHSPSLVMVCGANPRAQGWSESVLSVGSRNNYRQDPDRFGLRVSLPVNCATATMMAALEAAQVSKGHRILILGGGMLGLTFAAIAKAIDGVELLICERNQHRFPAAQT